MNEADILKAIAKAAAPPKPAWLPSDQWDALERRAGVVSNADLDRIEKAIEAAPEAHIAAAISAIGNVVKSFLPIP
jgi:hypothetical protein